VKTRRAADIVEQRFGWRPRIVGRLVVFADTTTNRRRVAAHSVLDAAYPARGRVVTEWLKNPIGPMSGLMFVSLSPVGAGRRSPVSRSRGRPVRWCVAQGRNDPDSGDATA
jgi:hypothetical protein